MARKAPSRRSPAKAAAPDFTGDERICVIIANDELLRRQACDKLRDAIATQHGAFETFTFDGDSATLAEVFDELRSYSLMQSYKLVVLEQPDQFVKHHREALERYAEHPVDHATLLMRGRLWNKGKKLDDRIAKVGCIHKLESLSPHEARAWLIQRARSEHETTLSDAAAAELVERLGPDMQTLDTELAKLVAAVGDGQIDRPLIDRMVGHTSEAQAWLAQEATLKALITGQPGPLIDTIHELIDLADQPEALVHYFVADLIRKLNQGLMMKRAGVSEGQIAKQLKMWGERQPLFLQALRQFNGRVAGELFDRIIQADQRTKSGFGEPMRNLECFCAQLADVGK